jgi:hypothetical protein
MSWYSGSAIVLMVMVAAIATPTAAFLQGSMVSLAHAGKLEATTSGALALVRHHRDDFIAAKGRGRKLLLSSLTTLASSSSSSSDPFVPDRPAMRLRGGAIMPRLGLLRRGRAATAVKSSIMPANNGDNVSKKPTAIYLLVSSSLSLITILSRPGHVHLLRLHLYLCLSPYDYPSSLSPFSPFLPDESL